MSVLTKSGRADWAVGETVIKCAEVVLTLQLPVDQETFRRWVRLKWVRSWKIGDRRFTTEEEILRYLESCNTPPAKPVIPSTRAERAYRQRQRRRAEALGI